MKTQDRRPEAAGADYLDIHAARAIVRTFGPQALCHADRMVAQYVHDEMPGDAHRWRRVAVAIREIADEAVSAN